MKHRLQSYNLEMLAFLVVDENPHMRMLISSILRSLGVRQVSVAQDGETALASIKETGPDIILTGLGMSPMGGIQFIKLLRNGGVTACQKTPVIVVSSYTERHFVEQARDAGMDEFLAKPISPRALYDRIVRIIENRRPFVAAEMYFGPDRRHHVESRVPTPRRKTDPKPTALERK